MGAPRPGHYLRLEASGPSIALERWRRPACARGAGIMGGGHVVIGIHGLANKPPEEEKAKWWLAAIREGIERNCASVPAAFPFDFTYWASLRYAEPLGSD